MGKSKSNPKPAGPDRMTMNLFAPGMSGIHQAGLGGLVCTLKYIEKARKDRKLKEEEIPGGPWKDGKPPWEIDEQSVTLDFGEPQLAGQFLNRLFAIGFGLDKEEGLMFLPGQHDRRPGTALLADLQLGLTLTFLQHGKTRQLAKDARTVSYDPDDTGLPGVILEYRPCSGYKHQEAWKDLVNEKTGCLSGKTVAIEGPLNPGAVVRHNAYSADTKVEDPPERLLPLYFALIGCVALPINRGMGVLMIPVIEDLNKFARQRPRMTPRDVRQVQIPNAADAVLQMMVRLKAEDLRLAGCHAVTFRPTAWASQQKSRVDTLVVPTLPDKTLELFEAALAKLKPRVIAREVKESTGKGKAKVTTTRQEAFRTDSVVRPLVAENIAKGRPWYAGFTRLMVAKDNNGNAYRDKLPFESGGLNAMTTDNRFLESEGETVVVRAVHEAMRQRFGRIADDYKSNPAGMKNKFGNERERLRLAFSGAKTASQVRGALCDLFSRGGVNETLQDSWTKILPMFRGDWQLTRDLALLALASYAGKNSDVDPKQEPENK